MYLSGRGRRGGHKRRRTRTAKDQNSNSLAILAVCHRICPYAQSPQITGEGEIKAPAPPPAIGKTNDVSVTPGMMSGTRQKVEHENYLLNLDKRRGMGINEANKKKRQLYCWRKSGRPAGRQATAHWLSETTTPPIELFGTLT